MKPDTARESKENIAETLLKLTQELIDELRPGKTQTFVLSLDHSLDTDLGLDSLSRVELISRLEQSFKVTLPQRVFTDAESPRDLLREIINAQGRQQAYATEVLGDLSTEKVENLPHRATTLIDVLQWHVKHHPDRLHVRVLGEEEKQDSLTYVQLWQGAQDIAAGLQHHGIQPGETVAIMLPTSTEYLFSFFAILLAGAIPVPIYPPVRRSQLEEHLRRHSGILNNCAATILITVAEAKVVAQLLKSQVTSMRNIVTVSELTTQQNTYKLPVINSDDIAFLQYTSGSTGNPKGVVLTHANLLANIRAMGEAVNADSSDTFVSWLPLYHDMGLIGAWLGSLYFAVQFIVMSPLAFLMRPQRWLWTIHQFHGTLSASPNFGYELCLKRITNDDIKGLDLSNWRLAFNGAEPISPDTIKRFTEKLQPAGFRPETMMPVYGLAESAVGLAFPPLNRKPLIDCVNRETFMHSANAIAADKSDQNALCFVGCGRPLLAHQIRIVDPDGRELPERQEGYLQFRGPSATSGYYRNPVATQQLFDNDWLDSGDLAYIAEGDVFITGRSKDLIIRAGRNIYPHEIEEAVGNINGIRKGCVAAFGTTEVATGTERLVILAETRESTTEAKNKLDHEVVELANDLIGMPPDEVVLAPPHTVLKTSSGKVRRSACRELYETGQLGQPSSALWVQISRTALRSLLPEWRRLKQRLSNSLYAGYSWTAFGFLSALAWLAVVLSPYFSWRWYAIRSLAKSCATATRTRIDTHGLDYLLPQDHPCIYVVNHASYIDSFALVAAIPRTFSFIAKKELRDSFFSRLPLDKLEVVFVERFDKEKGIIDAQRIANVAEQKQSLLFFPEGTFSRMPGLLNFHLGAFLTAAQLNIPVIPIAIRGTRSILRAESWFPRRGRITITVGEAIKPDQLFDVTKEDAWRIALKLRDEARKHILNYCGEPDLSEEKAHHI